MKKKYKNKKKQKGGNLLWYEYILIIIGIIFLIFIIKKIFFENVKKNKNYDPQIKAPLWEHEEKPDPTDTTPNRTKWILSKNIEEKILQNIENQKNSKIDLY